MKQRETLIRKIIPVELFDMAGLEHWLSDMAAQGLHLVKLNHDTARFRRGEPVSGVRFGLEITGVADIDRELDLCDHPPEPVLCLPNGAGGHPAPPHRSGAPEPAVEKAVPLGPPGLCLGRGPSRVGGCSDRSPAGGHAHPQSADLFGLYQLCSLPAAWAEVQDLSRLVRRLEAGEPMDHRAPYPRRRLVPLLSFSLCILLIVLLVLPRYILPFLGGGMRPIGEVSDFSPLSLAQVEGQGYRPYEMEDPNQSD